LAAPLPAATEAAAPGAADEALDSPGFLQMLLSIVIVALFFITFIAQAFVIPSGSMESTLLVGDYVFVDKSHFAPAGGGFSLLPSRPLRRGDIIVFHYPENPSQHFVKRVVALPGDRLHLRDKRLFLNGVEQREFYARYTSFNDDRFRDDFPAGDRDASQLSRRWYDSLDKHLERGELIVPPGACFAMGDNRDDSLDSRYWGFVPLNNIIGRPLVIYWSMQMQPLDDDDEDSPAAEGSPRHSLRTLASFWDMVRSAATGIRWHRIFHVIG
jgi:signal peptidase I